MKFTPIVTLWILLPICILLTAFTFWYCWKQYKVSKKIPTKWLLRASLPLLLLLTLLNPSIKVSNSRPGVSNLDVLFIVDTTASVGSTDYKGSEMRITGIKDDMLTIGSQLQGAYMGIITFASENNLLMPYNSDPTEFSSVVRTINQEVYGSSRGTTLDKPLDLAKQQLKARMAVDPGRKRLIFYLSDGENNTPGTVQSFAPLAEYVNGGAVLGYGTKAGAKIIKYTGLPINISEPNQSYIMTINPTTKNETPAISHMDSMSLKAIAKQLGITYFDRNNGSNISSVINASGYQSLITKSNNIKHYLPLYWLFAIPLTILILWVWKGLLFLELDLNKTKEKRHGK